MVTVPAEGAVSRTDVTTRHVQFRSLTSGQQQRRLVAHFGDVILHSPGGQNTWSSVISLTRQALGLRATRQPLWGHKVAPLYFYDDIVATRRDREAKLRTHLSEYLAEVVSKFGVDLRN